MESEASCSIPIPSNCRRAERSSARREKFTGGFYQDRMGARVTGH